MRGLLGRVLAKGQGAVDGFGPGRSQQGGDMVAAAVLGGQALLDVGAEAVVVPIPLGEVEAGDWHGDDFMGEVEISRGRGWW